MKINKMKSFTICSQLFIIVSVVSSANIVKRQTNVNNLDNIQTLLQELEKANININEISNNVNKNTNKVTETPVRDALGRLFTAFQQMASAYVGVLTSVGKSIGIPTIGAQGVQYLQAPIGIKQIGENLRQFQDSMIEVSRSIENFFTRQAPQDAYVLTNEMRKFLRLWSNQVQEVSDQVSRAFGGLQAEGSSITIPMPILDILQQIIRVFEETFQRVSRIFSGRPKGSGVHIREGEEPKPSSQLDLINEFKQLLELIQKRMKALTKQLDNIIPAPNTGDPQTAEPKL